MPEFAHPNRAIQSTIISNATVVPIYPPYLRDMKSGVFGEDGQLVESSLLFRDVGPIVRGADFCNASEILEGEYIFGGYLFDHFGHFLLESCSKLWFAKKNPRIPIVWALGTGLRPYQKEVLSLLGISNPHVFLKKPTCLDALHIPDQAYKIQGYCSPTMVDLMGCWRGDIQPDKKIWISRSDLPATVGIVHSEKRLEERLAEVGWQIFHPEKHSISEQLKTYASAEHLAGFAGSAFHSLLLLEDHQGSVSIFERGSPINRNYLTIAQAKALKQTVHKAPMVAGKLRGYMTSYSLPSLAPILNILRPRPSPHIPSVRETHSSRRVNTLAKAISAENYLEVGVALGETFLNVDIENKKAVDPSFRFDYTGNENTLVKFFEITSDEYFINHADKSKFDVVFLDGLHTFEQTFRDFCNTLNVTHDKSIIIIDDTIPSDVYSSWPNQEQAVRFRSEAGGKGGAWHGDVFKTVFAIHDFFPMLSYLTINTQGNPQTIVWREPRRDFQPLWNSLEAVNRLSWFDLRRNIESMNRMTEAAGLEHVISRLGAKLSQ